MTGCNKDDGILKADKHLLEFSFQKSENPDLLDDVHLAIEGNSVYGRIPYFTQVDSLIASFNTNGDHVNVNGQKQRNGVSPNDFSKVVTYSVNAEDGSFTNYQIDLTLFTGLPILHIETENGSPIVSKDERIPARINVTGGRSHEDFSGSMEIRGRGHTSWTYPKKPYQISFEDKVSILGMPQDKNWILLANYADKTMLRNHLAFTIGSFSGLEWTPQSQFVELYLNQKYRGTYELTQKVEQSKNRVDIGKSGFLLEIDQLHRVDSGDVFFETPKALFVIKEPKVEFGSSSYNYIKEYITRVETVLYSAYFHDPEEGYPNYIDVASFVDWYLINEITRNNDAIFFSSVYLNLVPGKKLKMGPIWDYDLAFGNIIYAGNELPEGFHIKNSTWINRLFEDQTFVDQVKERFNYYRAKEEALLLQLEAASSYLQLAQEENDLVWQTLGKEVWPNPVYYETYKQEVNHLRSWIEARMNWLETAFNEL